MSFLRPKSSEFGIMLSATEHAVIICVQTEKKTRWNKNSLLMGHIPEKEGENDMVWSLIGGP